MNHDGYHHRYELLKYALLIMTPDQLYKIAVDCGDFSCYFGLIGQCKPPRPALDPFLTMTHTYHPLRIASPREPKNTN